MASKNLIAFFSRKGLNYVDGGIVNLPEGNTEVIANKIQVFTGGGNDIFRIETVTPYPEYYTEVTEIAQRELRNNSRPAIIGEIQSPEQYEVIFLGYPNWWGTMPMAVFTFLEKYSFDGKTILPFCTHEGSGLGSSQRDISTLCPKAIIRPGLAIRGGSVQTSDEMLKDWLLSNNLLKR